MKHYHIQGLHCASCKIFIENALEKEGLSGKVDIKKSMLYCECSDSAKDTKRINAFSNILQEKGYHLSDHISEKKDETIWIALPGGLLVIIVFILLQKSGILSFSVQGSITPLASFLIGISASLSSCLAIVGGLILSLSSEIAKQHKNKMTPIITFHVSRIIGFTILGGLLGFLGSLLQINTFFSGILGVFASLVMIVLGLDLLGVLKRNISWLPSGIFRIFDTKRSSIFATILLGVGTFFLPCGFTQSMQISALSSGSFSDGSMIMFYFALGTLPVLATLSFGSYSFAQSKYAPLFFKTIGVFIIGFGIITIITGLTGLGIIPPFISL